MTVQKPRHAALVWLLAGLAGSNLAVARPVTQIAVAAPVRNGLRAGQSAGAQTAGAWESVGSGPGLYSRGLWYDLALRPTGTLPSTARVTTVHWSWRLSRIPAGLQVLLCWVRTQHCMNISARQSGGTRAFAGLRAQGPVIFAFRVSGALAMSPVYGAPDQIIVNYVVR